MPYFEITSIMVLLDKIFAGKLLSISSFIALNFSKRDVLKNRLTIRSPLCEHFFGRPLHFFRSNEPDFSCFWTILNDVDFGQPTFLAISVYE